MTFSEKDQLSQVGLEPTTFVCIHVIVRVRSIHEALAYALRMVYDNEACCFTHRARRYHGWHGNSSRFLDLPVRMMKTSATCGCQAWMTR